MLYLFELSYFNKLILIIILILIPNTFTNDCQPSFLIQDLFNYYEFLFLLFGEGTF